MGKKLKKEMDAGKLKKRDPDKTAFSIWSSFLGFNLMISRHGDMTLDAAEELFQVQFDIIKKGVL